MITPRSDAPGAVLFRGRRTGGRGGPGGAHAGAARVTPRQTQGRSKIVIMVSGGAGRAGHVAAGPAGGLGDVAAAGQVQRADREVAQAGHDAGAGAGAGAGVVFAVDGVAQPVQRLHAPVVADQPRDVGRGGLAACRLVTPSAATAERRGAGQVGDVAFDQPYLLDVGEREVGRGGQGLDGAGGDPAVPAVGLPVRDRDLASRAARRARRTEPGWLCLTVNTNPAPRWCR